MRIMSMTAAEIAAIQDEFDQGTPTDKERFVVEFRRLAAAHEQVDVPVLLTWIALSQSVSIAKAYEMAIDAAADGSLRMTLDDEQVPASAFRTEN